MAQADARPRMITTLVIVGGSFEPSECTQVLGITPTATCRKGERRKEYAPPAHASEWGWQTGWLLFESIDDSVSVVIDKFWPLQREVRAYVKDVGAQVAVVTAVEVYEDRPEYGLSRRTIKRLAALGAEYSMDLYDYRQD
jgi:hypothetical protein